MIKKICNGNTEVFPYIARLPHDMRDGLPIIIQLHGAGERGNGSDEEINRVEVHGFAHVFTDDAQIDCVLIQPQCREDSFWVAHIQELRLFIEEMVQTYHSDKSRVYLTGISMGGYGTWFTAMAFPQMFAAIAPVCGGGSPGLAKRTLFMPVWAFHGDSDTTVLPQYSTDIINSLQSRKTTPEVKFTLLKDVGHNAWDYAYNAELLDWLLAQKNERSFNING